MEEGCMAKDREVKNSLRTKKRDYMDNLTQEAEEATNKEVPVRSIDGRKISTESGERERLKQISQNYLILVD